MTDERTEFGLGIEEAIREAVAWKRGKIALEVRRVDPMSAERIRAIRKTVAKSTAAFAQKFGIPAATVNNWEQGRRSIDPAASLLFRVIEMNPEAVEKAAKSVGS